MNAPYRHYAAITRLIFSVTELFHADSIVRLSSLTYGVCSVIFIPVWLASGNRMFGKRELKYLCSPWLIGKAHILHLSFLIPIQSHKKNEKARERKMLWNCHSRRSQPRPHLVGLSVNIKISKWKSIGYVPAFTIRHKYQETWANHPFQLILET